MQKFLDEANDGAIYFSMGSNLKSTEMPAETVAELTKAFSKLKQKIIWKWEDETLPGKPANVRLGIWLPQSDILGIYFIFYFCFEIYDNRRTGP